YIDELLTNPRKATAWWFSKNTDKVNELSPTAEQFSHVADKLTPGPELDSIAAIVTTFQRHAAPELTSYFRNHFGMLLEDSGQDELLRRWQDAVPQAVDAR
ncbi:MAG: hypothetical protein ACRDRL_20850, partial [Sciscionella sp.]